MKELTLDTYLSTFALYPSHRGIRGGTLHEFLRESTVMYHGGRCPIYYIEHWHNGNRAVIGGCFATNGKPRTIPFQSLDF